MFKRIALLLVFLTTLWGSVLVTAETDTQGIETKTFKTEISNEWKSSDKTVSGWSHYSYNDSTELFIKETKQASLLKGVEAVEDMGVWKKTTGLKDVKPTYHSVGSEDEVTVSTFKSESKNHLILHSVVAYRNGKVFNMLIVGKESDINTILQTVNSVKTNLQVKSDEETSDKGKGVILVSLFATILFGVLMVLRFKAKRKGAGKNEK